MRLIKDQHNKWKKAGLILTVLSFAFYGAILLVPFTLFQTKAKIVLSSVLAIFGEVSFWVGAVILGKDFVAKYRRFFNPLNWFKKQSRFKKHP